MEFAAPKPLPLSKALAVVYPLDYLVWLLVFISFFVSGIIFWILANAEGRIRGHNFRFAIFRLWNVLCSITPFRRIYKMITSSLMLNTLLI